MRFLLLTCVCILTFGLASPALAQISTDPGPIGGTGSDADEVWTFFALEKTVEFNPDDGVQVFDVELGIIEDDENDDYPQDTSAFSMAVAHDGDLLDILDVEQGDVMADLNEGDGPTYWSTVLEPGGSAGFTLDVIYDEVDELFVDFEFRTIVALPEYELISDEFIDETDDVLVDITFDSTLSDAVVNAIVRDDALARPEFDHGVVTLVPTRLVFKRGDIDGNGSVSALLDSLFVLEFAFASGEEPPCMDAADVDDNGSLSALLDALALLNYFFNSGDTPPDPGPDDCGPDGTDTDDLSCNEPPDCS